MATVAVFIALGGGAYAAVKLPKNSVGTTQLKNGAVTKAKVNKKVLAALKGAAGAKGAQGAQGVKGDPGAKGDTGAKGDPGTPGETGQTGATGPSDVFQKSGTPALSLPADGSTVTVTSATLQPGKYELTANLGVANNSNTAPTDALCYFEMTPAAFTNNQHVYVPTRGGTDGYYHVEMMQLAAAGTLTSATTVNVKCELPTANMRGLSWLETSRFQALRVGSVTDL
jgi:hypothetical protein